MLLKGFIVRYFQSYFFGHDIILIGKFKLKMKNNKCIFMLRIETDIKTGWKEVSQNAF